MRSLSAVRFEPARVAIASLAMAALVAIGPAAAAEPETLWRVAEASGDVQVRTEYATRSASAGMLIWPSDIIETGPEGSVMLSDGSTSVAAFENTRFHVEKTKTGSVLRRVVQQAGDLLFNVEKHRARHFEVETPYFVAGVKGTTFGITVNPTRTSVSVLEGLVGVREPHADHEVDVGAGQIVRADRDRGLGQVEAMSADEAGRWTARARELASATSGIGETGANGGTGEGVGNAAGGTSVGSATETVSEAAGSAGGAVGEAAGSVGETVGEAAGSVGETVGEAAGSVGETVGEAAGSVGETVGEAAGSVGETVGEAAGSVGETVGEAVGSVF